MPAILGFKMVLCWVVVGVSPSTEQVLEPKNKPPSWVIAGLGHLIAGEGHLRGST